MNRHLRHLAAALLLSLATACGSSGGDSGPAITVTLSAGGGGVAVGTPSLTAALVQSEPAGDYDAIRITLGNLAVLGGGGEYEVWAVKVLDDISLSDVFISLGRFTVVANPKTIVGGDSSGGTSTFAQQTASLSTVTLPVSLLTWDQVWVSVEADAAESPASIPGGSNGPSPLLVGNINPNLPAEPVALAFPADLSGATGTIRIPIDGDGVPEGTVEVTFDGLPRLTDTGAAFTYEAWRFHSGQFTSLGRFDVDATGKVATIPDPFNGLISSLPGSGDQLLISIEPIDDPEPAALYPFIPLSGQFVLP